MVTLLAIVLLGFVLGMRHATDPDHVVAVAAIVSREKTILHATIIGALWGLGHTITILIVGAAIILFRLTIPPDLGLSMELSVGLMLILLGASNLTGVTQRWIERFTNRQHDTGTHSHLIGGHLIVHSHDSTSEAVISRRESFFDGLSLAWRKFGLFHILRPLTVGIVHGLAGSAAIALLVLTTISSAQWAIAYLLIFGLGTIAGMMMITAAIALPFTYTLRHFTSLNRNLAVASGILSMCFGLFLCYQTGVVGGLFMGRPSWTAH